MCVGFNLHGLNQLNTEFNWIWEHEEVRKKEKMLRDKNRIWCRKTRWCQIRDTKIVRGLGTFCFCCLSKNYFIWLWTFSFVFSNTFLNKADTNHLGIEWAHDLIIITLSFFLFINHYLCFPIIYFIINWTYPLSLAHFFFFQKFIPYKHADKNLSY